MSDRAWMYTGHPSQKEMMKEWFVKTKKFVKDAFANGEERNYCRCPGCDNYKKTTQAVMIKHLRRRGFKPNYTVWTFHGESIQRTRAEVVRRCTDEHGTGIEDMLQDFDDARDSEDEMEESAKAFMKCWSLQNVLSMSTLSSVSWMQLDK